MDDLISRQAAIDALEWKWAGKAAFDAIKNLPAAEPSEEQVKEYCRRRNLAIIAREDFPLLAADPSGELIRCKDCLMHGVCRFEQGLGLDGYCSQAERRSDE